MIDAELDSILEDWWDNQSDYVVSSDLTDSDLQYIISQCPDDDNPFSEELKQRNLPVASLETLKHIAQRILDIPGSDRHMENYELQKCFQFEADMEEESWTILAKSILAL